MEWTEVRAGTINEAHQRLWLALGDKADLVAERMITDTDYLGYVAEFAIRSLAISAPAIKPAVSSIIKPTRPFDPAAVFGDGHTIWLGPEDGDGLHGKEERDPRSFELEGFDLLLVEHTIILRRGESYTRGSEQIRRLKNEKAEHIRLDPSFALALREKPELYPDAWKDKAIFWDGLTLRGPDGDRYSVCSIWLDGEVVLDDRWHDVDGRSADGPSALLASKHSALAA